MKLRSNNQKMWMKFLSEIIFVHNFFAVNIIDQQENARGVNIGGNLWVQRFLVNFHMLITYMLGGRAEAGAFSSYKVLQDICKGL